MNRGAESVGLVYSQWAVKRNAQDMQVKPCALSKEATKNSMRRRIACRVWHRKKMSLIVTAEY